MNPASTRGTHRPEVTWANTPRRNEVQPSGSRFDARTINKSYLKGTPYLKHMKQELNRMEEENLKGIG